MSTRDAEGRSQFVPIAAAENVADPDDSPLSLTEFLDGLRDHVQAYPAAWVTAEVISATPTARSFTMELTETGADGQRSATATARMWGGAATHLEGFRRVTGEEPRAGMRILVYLRAQFHPQFGLSLRVLQLDPSYTLGEIEAQLQRARQRLKDGGFYGRNRLLPYPADFRRVAVISPSGAAARGDFRETADRLERAGVCAFSYRDAVFQGPDTVDSLMGAMKTIVREHIEGQSFNALCLIRGGGATAGLTELNSFKIAHAVCCAPLPVLTGIGHQRDNVLLDEVASRRFDTPSKVVQHIEQSIVGTAQSAALDWQTILTETHRASDDARRDIDSLFDSVRLDTDRAFADSRRGVLADMQQVLGLSPEHTMARGFAVVRDAAGRVVPTREAAVGAPTADLTLEFSDGKLPIRRRLQNAE